MRIDKNKIEVIMARKQMTYNDLGKSCDRTPRYIAKIVQQHTDTLTPKTVGIIAAGLGVDVTDIIYQ